MEFSADTKAFAEALEQIQGARVAQTDSRFGIQDSRFKFLLNDRVPRYCENHADLKTKFSSRTDAQAADLKNRGPRYPLPQACQEGSHFAQHVCLAGCEDIVVCSW
jgi:hypothetical protein